MEKRILKHIDNSLLALGASVLICIFILGGVFGQNNWHPYKFISDSVSHSIHLIGQIIHRRPHLLVESEYPGDGVTKSDPARAYPGLTLIQGVFNEGVELRLLDMDGNIVRTWPADFHKIWPDPKHVQPQSRLPNTDFSYHTHGMWIEPDGAVVFNFGELGMVKLDKCANVEWTLDRMTHHALTRNPDGSFWVPGKKNIYEVDEGVMLPTITRERLANALGLYEDTLIKVSADGKILREISVLEAIYDAKMEHMLHDVQLIAELDPTHVNDIEVVNAALAAKIDGVDEGDLLVSVRQMHALFIMDNKTGKIKWTQLGPWVRQHDPDITEDGIIEVFNNRPSPVLSDIVSSNIIAFDAATRTSKILYPSPMAPAFHTDIMGAHERLPNGNRLIAESLKGRVFEITPTGDIVWEYVKPFDKKLASLIEVALRFDEDYFTVDDWSCPPPVSE